MTSYRKGSMGAADEKNLKLALKVFSAIFFVVYVLFLFNIGGNFFHHYYKNAGLFWNVIAPVSALVHYWFIWNKLEDVENPVGSLIAPQQIILFGWFLLNILFFAGWKFPLP